MDPYGLVCEAGTWWRTSGGEPRLFRVSRVTAVVPDEAPVRRRDWAELAGLRETLRARVEDRPAGVRADLARTAAEVPARYS